MAAPIVGGEWLTRGHCLEEHATHCLGAGGERHDSTRLDELPRLCGKDRRAECDPRMASDESQEGFPIGTVADNS